MLQKIISISPQHIPTIQTIIDRPPRNSGHTERLLNDVPAFMNNSRSIKRMRNTIHQELLFLKNSTSMPQHHAFIPTKYKQISLKAHDLTLKEFEQIYTRTRLATWGRHPELELPLPLGLSLAGSAYATALLFLESIAENILGSAWPLSVPQGLTAALWLTAINISVRYILRSPWTYRVLFNCANLSKQILHNDRESLTHYLAAQMTKHVQYKPSEYVWEKTVPVEEGEDTTGYEVRNSPNGKEKVLYLGHYIYKLDGIEMFEPLRGKAILNDILSHLPQDTEEIRRIREYFSEK